MAHPAYHIRLCNALNAVGKASEEMAQAYLESRNPEYEKLHLAAHRLYAKFQTAFSKSCARGRREGWIK